MSPMSVLPLDQIADVGVSPSRYLKNYFQVFWPMW